MKELIRALRPVKGRLRLERMLRGTAAGLAAGAGAALILLAVTVFLPLDGRWRVAGLLAALGIVAGALTGVLRPVRDAEAARAADACGLQERAVTALETAGKTPPDARTAGLWEALRQDAAARLKALDPAKIRLRMPKRTLAAGAALLLLCGLTALIPSPGDRIAAAARELKEKTAAMAERIDAAETEEEKTRSEKEKTELRKLTEDLKRELAGSRDEVDVLAALDRAETRLEKLRDQTGADALKALEEAMHGAGMDAAAQALESGDAQALSAALEGAEAEALQAMAEGLDGEAAEMARQLTETAKSGAADREQTLSAMMGNGAQQSPLQQALDAMKAAAGGQASQTGNGRQPGAGQNGAGQGAGNQGQNGSGAGSGSTNEEQQGAGGQRQSGGGTGNRPPEYREREYEAIYDSEKAEAAFRNVSTEQHAGEKDSVQIETGPGKGTVNGSVPFREVLGEYVETETRAAENARLTVEQKQWVDDYFRNLTEE